MPVLPTNLTGCGKGLFSCTAQYANDATSGLFWTLALLGFVVVIFLASQRFGTARSYGFASVVGMFGAVLFVLQDLMDWYVASIFILAGVLGFVVLIVNKS